MTDMQGPVPTEAREAIDRLSLDGSFIAALQDPAHPGHKSATAHRRSLYVSAYGGETAEQTAPAPDGKTADTADDLFVPPEDPKDYRFDSAPYGLPYDGELDRKARCWFHQGGVPQWLARNIVSEWNRAIERRPDAERIENDAAATERALRRSWGDKYDAKVAAAQSLLRSLKDDEAMSLLDSSGLANNEYLIRQLVALIESRHGEDDL